jgi:GAF domain-containing protein
LEAPRPHDERERLAALLGYEILDTQPERAFDDLARLAGAVSETPIALVSLVDETRQWFKARLGLAAEETPRELAFCAHAILEDRVLVVEDAAADPRFADNALVTGEPGIRFYAGAPLRTPSGHQIGTICAIDRRPRELDENQLAALQALARLVVDELELRLVRIQRERFSSSHLPMCSMCKKVRDEKDVWHAIEGYLGAVSHVQVSHGLCDDCVQPYEAL